MAEMQPTKPGNSRTRETPEAAPTTSHPGLYSISGRVFFDDNANGEMEADESPLMFIPISLNDYAYETVSDEDGFYQIEDLPAGRYDLHIESPEMFDPSYLLRYIALSDESIQSIQIPVTLQAAGDVSRDFGLAQGFLTMPVPCGMETGSTHFVDLDQQVGTVRRWDGLTASTSIPDQNQGIDYHGERYTPVLAAAPGIVIRAADEGDETNSILILHDLGDEKFVTGYSHNDSVVVGTGEKVKRGQEIALMGNAGTEEVHVHFALWPIPQDADSTHAAFQDYIFNPQRWPWITDGSGGDIPSGLDMYQDQNNKSTRSYWTAHNKPVCIPAD